MKDGKNPVDFEFKDGAYREALDFFRQKVNMPTERWYDLKGIMHSRAFAVAGAMRDDVLSDFRSAVDKAIASGSTLADFRKAYDAIALKWSETDKVFEAKNAKPGYAAWRSKVIYSTNLAVAYSAGREEQMHDPDMKDIWTYAIYKTMGDGSVRDEHAVWNDVVLPINDPWWITHTPPCGWGCRCWKEPLTEEEAKKIGIREKAPKTPMQDAKMEGAGWDHNPGMADKGNAEAMREYYKQQKEKYKGEWEPIPQNNYYKQGKKPEPLTPLETNIKPLKDPLTPAQFKKVLNEYLNVEKKDFKTFEKSDGKGFTFSYAVDTKFLTDHLAGKEQSKWESRSKYVELMASTINDPQRIAVEFTKSKGTGKVAIRQVFYKSFKCDGEDIPIKVVFDGRMVKDIGFENGIIKDTSKPAFKGWTTYQDMDVKGVVIYEKP